MDRLSFKCVKETKGLMFFSSSVYFELRLRFPADWRTVAIGSSDGVSECSRGCAVGQRKTSRCCGLGSFLLHGSLGRGSVV